MAKSFMRKLLTFWQPHDAELIRPTQTQWITVLKQMTPAAPNPYGRADKPDQTGERD